MIYDQKTGEQIDLMAHQEEFDRWKKSIPKNELDIIVDYINNQADLSDKIRVYDLITPGKWLGTPFQPVYLRACFMDDKLSMMFMELILWFTIQNRQDEWFYKDAAGNSSAAEKYYFRKLTV